MSASFVGLLAAICVLGVLLLNLNLRSPWPWQVKVGATVITFALLLGVYFATVELLGWPTTQPLPEKFELLSADVHEPDKRTRSDGAIFIWAKPIDAGQAQPRAYRLAYSPALHRQLDMALQQMRDGSKQAGTIRSRPRGVPGERQGIDVRFHDLRRRSLPEKKKR